MNSCLASFLLFSADCVVHCYGEILFTKLLPSEFEKMLPEPWFYITFLMIRLCNLIYVIVYNFTHIFYPEHPT